MTRSHFVDLDELLERTRSVVAREHIEEAVRCYRSGAYRACIITTWIAVVFDFIEKLRELELTGDKEARHTLESFEKIRQTSDFRSALEFERNVLEWSKNEFQFLTPQEYADL